MSGPFPVSAWQKGKFTAYTAEQMKEKAAALGLRLIPSRSADGPAWNIIDRSGRFVWDENAKVDREFLIPFLEYYSRPGTRLRDFVPPVTLGELLGRNPGEPLS